MAKNRRRARKNETEPSRRQVIQIDVLPDDVLLEIFDFYMIMNRSYGGKLGIEAWQSLVHVCQRWRSLVLASPRRLNLQLYCTHDTPVLDNLDIWPSLPLIVGGFLTLSGTANIVAALGQSNRVCQVDLYQLQDWQLESVLPAMQVPFPELTDLRLESQAETPPVIPDSFLGGSAPHLRQFNFNIPFPGLPKLLLSATHLVRLRFRNAGYISPEAMIALLAVLTSLESLSLGFKSHQSRPDWERLSLKRSILPALNDFHFGGVTEYLEELVTFIEAPQLNFFYITFFNQIDFDTPRLTQFINRTPTLRALDKVHVKFDRWTSSVAFLVQSRTLVEISILCREPDRQFSSVAQVCNSFLHPLSTVEDLYIERRYGERVFQLYAIENTQWLQLLLPFTAVKSLYIRKEFAPGIAAALQELDGGRITELLPSLQNILVEGLEPSGPLQENIGQFVAARQLSGHPVAISDWDKD